MDSIGRIRKDCFLNCFYVVFGALVVGEVWCQASGALVVGVVMVVVVEAVISGTVFLVVCRLIQ